MSAHIEKQKILLFASRSFMVGKHGGHHPESGSEQFGNHRLVIAHDFEIAAPLRPARSKGAEHHMAVFIQACIERFKILYFLRSSASTMK